MIELALAVQFLHSRNIAHGDIQWVRGFFIMNGLYIEQVSTQPNIVVNTDCTVRIWNFGFNRRTHHETATANSYEYVVPKSWDQKPTKRGDLYSCGIAFLSLALASTTTPSSSSSTANVASNEFQQLAGDLEGVNTLGWAVPSMPLSFFNVKKIRKGGIEPLWRLIVDMTSLQKVPNLTIDDIVERLRDSIVEK